MLPSMLCSDAGATAAQGSSPHGFAAPQAPPPAAGPPAPEKQQEAVLAAAWLQAVAADPAALANMRAVVGAKASRDVADGADPGAARHELVTALVRAIVETQASGVWMQQQTWLRSMRDQGTFRCSAVTMDLLCDTHCF
jgi:hypothetical protein